MAGMSKALATAVYNATLNGSGRSSLSAVANLYLALNTAEPDDDSAVASEATYPGYARVNVGTIFTGTATESTDGEDTLVVSNGSLIQFAASESATPQTISHWSIWTVSTGGTADQLLYSGALLDSTGAETTREIKEGDIPIFQSGEFKLKFI